MHFNRLSVENFGPFPSVDIDLSSTRVNIITGDNGSGKTQLFGAFSSAIAGRRGMHFNKSGTGPSSIKAELGDGDYREEVRITARLDGNAVRVTPDARHIAGAPRAKLLQDAFKDMLLLPQGSTLAFDRNSFPVKMSAAEVVKLTELVPAALKVNQHWQSFLKSGVLQDEMLSTSTGQIAQLLQAYFRRRKSPVNAPLLIDDYLSKADMYWQEFASTLILDLAQTEQIILFTNRRIDIPGANTIVLTRQEPEHQSLTYFHESYTRSPRTSAMSEKPKYVRGNPYPAVESKVCEFKEVKGERPLDSIKSLVDQYVVAFLNAGVEQQGKIVWGVRDKDRTIQGVSLTAFECDELKRVVTEKLMQIKPPIAPTMYGVKLIEVSDGTESIRDLYLLEIQVPSVQSRFLHATGRDEVYVKTDAGKRKLNAIELQLELLRRHGLKGQ